jgi:hypothetical protein
MIESARNAFVAATASDDDESDHSDSNSEDEAAATRRVGAKRGLPNEGSGDHSDIGGEDSDDDDTVDVVDASDADDMLGGLSEAEIATALKVVGVLGNRLELFRSRPFKAMRVAIHPLVREQMRRFESAEGTSGSGGGGGSGKSRRDRRGGGGSGINGGGGDSLSAAELLVASGTNRGRLNHLTPSERRKQMDRDALNARLLRAERLEKLEALNSTEGHDEEVKRLRVPDGVAGLLTFSSSTGAGAAAAAADGGGGGGLLTVRGGEKKGEHANDDEEEEGGQSTQTTRAPEREMVASSSSSNSSLALVAGAGAAPNVEPSGGIGAATRLHHSIGCYICKRPFQELHFFYASLCPTCAALNWRKRDEKANMDGAVVVVTGARVKIGFRCALKLLRAGATVRGWWSGVGCGVTICTCVVYVYLFSEF